MSGRGRGISNVPAWMSRGPDGANKRQRSQSPDAFGRVRDPRISRGGPPPPGPYDRRGGPPPPGWGRGPPPPPPYYRGGPPPPYHGGNRGGPRGGGDRGGGGGGGRRPRGNKSGIFFNSWEEERAWVENRRRNRLTRKSLWDVPPTAEQAAIDAKAAAMTNFAATDFSGVDPTSNLPQQTRHARRLYIGNLPMDVTEDSLHKFFREAIETALVKKINEDPILSVYINQERRFCFLEFKSVEMTTACMALDGIDVMGKGKVKVKRPNDYNPAMAPQPSMLPELDVSRLGIISTTVPDGPHKIFIGGLHYHLTEDQVLELLGAFGKVKAFHLVKQDPDATTSKGYCFAEYMDHNVTTIAVKGLSGMDLGNGKVLTARIANEKDNAMVAPPTPVQTAPMMVTGGATPMMNVVNGYNVDELVDAALGLRPMPTAPSLMGLPVTPLTPAMPTVPMPVPQQPVAPPAPPPPPAPPAMSALDIANAALAAAYPSKTRILVLLNMVSEEDLATDQDHNELMEEVREECAKFGNLLSMKIPREKDGVEPSAIKKIFLEYATVQDAANAEKELKGRQFGPNVVETSFFAEGDYQAGKLF